MRAFGILLLCLTTVVAGDGTRRVSLVRPELRRERLDALRKKLIGRWESYSFVSTNAPGVTTPGAIPQLYGATNLIFCCYQVGDWTTNAQAGLISANIDAQLFITGRSDGKERPVSEGAAQFITEDSVFFGSPGFVMQYAFSGESLILDKYVIPITGIRAQMKKTIRHPKRPH